MKNIEQTGSLMRFGQFYIPVQQPESAKSFKYLKTCTKPDEIQQALLDALWNASDTKNKLIAINCLNVYFSEIREKPIQKHFPFYVLFKGAKPGIYRNYSELQKFVRNYPNPQWRGFYSYDEAITEAWNRLGKIFYVEPFPSAYPADQASSSSTAGSFSKMEVFNTPIKNNSSMVVNPPYDPYAYLTSLQEQITMLQKENFTIISKFRDLNLSKQQQTQISLDQAEIIENLKAQLHEKDKEIAALCQKLEEAKSEIASLFSKGFQPSPNRSFSQLRSRVILNKTDFLDQIRTLEPAIYENIFQKAEIALEEKFVKIQRFLIQINFREIDIPGITISQPLETNYHTDRDQPGREAVSGFFKANVELDKFPSYTRYEDLLLSAQTLLDFGVLRSVVITSLENADIFGTRVQQALEYVFEENNYTQMEIFSTVPIITEKVMKPAKHVIFMYPEKRVLSKEEPQIFSHGDNRELYHWKKQNNKLSYPSKWQYLNLITETPIMKIWGPCDVMIDLPLVENSTGGSVRIVIDEANSTPSLDNYADTD